MKGRTVTSSGEWILGRLGFVLLVLLAWACDQESESQHTAPRYARRALARLVVASVTATGWAVDHLAPIAAPRTSARQSVQPIRGHQ
jgi:hypothetical protein